MGAHGSEDGGLGYSEFGWCRGAGLEEPHCSRGWRHVRATGVQNTYQHRYGRIRARWAASGIDEMGRLSSRKWVLSRRKGSVMRVGRPCLCMPSAHGLLRSMDMSAMSGGRFNAVYG